MQTSRMKSILGCTVFLSMLGSSLDAQEKLADGLYARLKTTRGEILLQLEFEKTPLTVTNFAGLAEGTLKTNKGSGKPFYDGITFHRVIANFMIQTGDPLGNGTGGPGYSFPDEIRSDLKHTGPGILSMANSGPNTNGSQFFITHVETSWLDGKHTVFGRVVSGQNVVNSIKQGDKIESVTIVRVGDKAKNFKTDQASFDALKASAMKEQEAQKAKQKEAAGKEREQNLAKIKAKWPALKTTASGLMYQTTKNGTGKKPEKGQTVRVHYTGTFLDGTVFDSSKGRDPLEFAVGTGRVIKGWDEGVLDMQAGEKRLLVLPPELAYGEQGAGGVIPPNAFLVFETELVSIK